MYMNIVVTLTKTGKLHQLHLAIYLVVAVISLNLETLARYERGTN